MKTCGDSPGTFYRHSETEKSLICGLQIDSLTVTVLRQHELMYKHMPPPCVIPVNCMFLSSQICWPKLCSFNHVYFSAVTQAFLFSSTHFTFSCSSSTLFLKYWTFLRIIEGSDRQWSPTLPYSSFLATLPNFQTALYQQIYGWIPLHKGPGVVMFHWMRMLQLYWSLWDMLIRWQFTISPKNNHAHPQS